MYGWVNSTESVQKGGSAKNTVHLCLGGWVDTSVRLWVGGWFNTTVHVQKCEIVKIDAYGKI